MRRPPLRWVLVALVALAMGAAGSYQFVWSTIRGPLGARLGAGETALGTVFTAFVLTQTLAQFPAGWYRDRRGPRRPLAVAVVLVAGGYAGVALAPTFPVALVAYALGGAGAGAVYTVAVNTPVKWFDDRRGLATGIVTMAYSASSAPIIRVVGPRVEVDFSGTLLALGAASGVACLAAVSLVRDPHRLPEGASAAAESGDGHGAAEATRTAGPAYTWRETIRTWQFWVLYAVFVAVQGVGLMLIGKVVSLAVGVGLPARTGTLAASVLAVANGTGVVVGGGASDRFGRTRTVAASLILCGVALTGTVVIGPRHALGFVALVGAAAFFRTPFLSVFPTIVADYYGADRSSENYALLYSAKVPGGIAGGTAASLLIAAVGWTAAFLLGAGLLVLAGLATAALRPVQSTARTAESAA